MADVIVENLTDPNTLVANLIATASKDGEAFEWIGRWIPAGGTCGYRLRTEGDEIFLTRLVMTTSGGYLPRDEEKIEHDALVELMGEFDVWRHSFW